MKPPYSISSHILKQLISIGEKLGEINAAHLVRRDPDLRRKNRIMTIQASLEIEGNTLSIDQITDIINGKRVLGPKTHILEVKNAIKAYEKMDDLTFDSMTSFLTAHKIMMEGLLDDPGKFRSKAVGIAAGRRLKHIAPPWSRVRHLMKDLFDYLKTNEDPILVKSCVFHYEMEFIHPFMDGNGRLGRFWQTKILSTQYPVFGVLPVETIIKDKQEQYYSVLEACDNAGESTQFIEFMLSVLDEKLAEIVGSPRSETMDYIARIHIAGERFANARFTRSDYLKMFKEISAPTASRDLKRAVEEGLLIKTGDKRLSSYTFKKDSAESSYGKLGK